MPDWRALVRQRLSGLPLDAEEKDEVQVELAAHLEESYEVFCREGLPEKEAVHRTFEQVRNWRDLQHRIFMAKRSRHPMKKRTRQLRIPGFLMLILSMVFLATLRKLGFNARMVSWRDSDILLYTPWLLSLPFFGALGAYMSWRAGGSRGTALLASAFPVLALTLAFLLMFPIGMIVERVIGNDLDFGFVAGALLMNGIGWLLVPGAALLVGGLVVHLLFSRRSSSQNTAIS